MNKKIKLLEDKLNKLSNEIKKEKNKYLKNHIKNLIKISKSIENLNGDPVIFSYQLEELLKGKANNSTIRWCLENDIPVVYQTKETGDTYSGNYTYYYDGKLGVYK